MMLAASGLDTRRRIFFCHFIPGDDRLDQTARDNLRRILRGARLTAGLTLRDAATIASEHGASISASFLGEFENGRYDTISVARLVALARTYNVPAPALLDEAQLAEVDDPNVRHLRPVASRETDLAALVDRVGKLERSLRLIGGVVASLDSIDSETRQTLLSLLRRL